jgi:hypothetical protein
VGRGGFLDTRHFVAITYMSIERRLDWRRLEERGLSGRGCMKTPGSRRPPKRLPLERRMIGWNRSAVRFRLMR